MDSLLISLQKILDDLGDAKDLRIDRLSGGLKKRDGITAVKIAKEKTSEPQLSITYKPDIISDDQIRKIVRETGKKLDKIFGHLRIKMQEIQDTQQIRATATLLKNIKGVMNVLVLPAGLIMVEFNKYITQESLLIDLIEQMDLVI